MNEIIKETENYKLVVGISTSSQNLCYQIINSKYEVLEIESYILAQAIKYIDDLEIGLQAQKDISKELH